MMTLLVASACPLHCGYAGVKYLFFYAQPTTIPPKGFTIKLKAVVQYESIWDSKSCNNILSHKLLHVLISDVGKRLDFDSFGETVSCNEEVSPVARSL